MANVCVITGGGSGMGLSAAKFMDKEKIIVISGRTESKLEKACEELRKEGHTVHYKTCDTSKRESVRELAEYANSLGTITNVINCAGMSPSMTNPETILRINALGTVFVNQEFQKFMGAGSVIVDIASNSAYAMPATLFKMFHPVYKLADIDEDKFLQRILLITGKIKNDYMASGMAYTLSKNFTTWYAAKTAFDLGDRGIRVCSLSPGLVSTDMGNQEIEHGGTMAKVACERRMGTPDELGYAIATVADERNGYLAGVDVLVDGGSTRGNAEFRKSWKNTLEMMGLVS